MAGTTPETFPVTLCVAGKHCRSSLLRAAAALFIAASVLIATRAQTPDTVSLFKVSGFVQTNATTLAPSTSYFIVAAHFRGSVSTSQGVKFNTPKGSYDLVRQDQYNYRLQKYYSTYASVEADFPEGSYSVELTGANANTATFNVTNPATISPSLITNFDALQSWPNTSPTVTWQPVNIQNDNGYVRLFGYDYTGVDFYSTDTLPGSTTTVTMTNAPLKTDLIMELIGARFFLSTAANNVTSVSVARGFDVLAPLYCELPKPTVLTQPSRYAVGLMGGTVLLRAKFKGTNNTFQLSKDSTTVSGISAEVGFGDDYSLVTYHVPIAQGADAGDYVIVATGPGGTVSSDPCTVVVPSKYSSSVFAGSSSSSTLEGSASAVSFLGAAGVARDAAGNLFVADSAHSIIRKISNGTVTTFAGTANAQGTADGTGAAARFYVPRGLTIDSVGNLYVTDVGNHNIRKITPAGVVTTVANPSGASGLVDGAAAGARFNEPSDVAVDSAGNLYVADTVNNAVRKITSAGVVSTIASHQFGSPTNEFMAPHAVALDSVGNLYVASGTNLWRIKSDNSYSRVLSTQEKGVGVYAGRGDGTDSLHQIAALRIDTNGVIFAATESALYRSKPGDVMQDVIGADGLSGSSDGVFEQARFSGISGLCVDQNANLYMSDSSNGLIRKAALVQGSTDPKITVANLLPAQAVKKGDTVVFKASATGPGLSYQWLKNGVPILDATNDDLLLSSTTDGDAASYSVMVGNGVGAVTSTAGTLSFATTSDVGRIINLSVRSFVQGDTVPLTVGFVVRGGAAASTKPLLIRGIGPTLTSFSVPGALGDPTLTLFNGSQSIKDNDDWGGTTTLKDAFTKTGAFSLDAASHDSATLENFSAGNYSVRIIGKNGNSGVVLAEMYDANNVAPDGTKPRLINVSSLTRSGTGANALAAGFVIGGTTSRTLLIRGVGPGLQQFGIGGVLANPVLTIYADSTVIATSQASALSDTAQKVGRQVGAFVASNTDAAVAITVPPGVYSAVVSDANNTEGNAIVEVYSVE